MNLNELKMIFLPDDFVEPLDLNLPLNDINLGVRLVRVKDHVNVDDYHRTMRQVNVDLGSDSESDYEGLYASVISYVKKSGEEISMSYSDKRDLLLNLDARSFNLISDLQDKYYHGYDLSIPFECTQCLEKSKVGFELGADFFFRTTSTTA